MSFSVPFVIYAYFSYFFFFKQKTAYEMRISDWSSDVCSSDLVLAQFQHRAHVIGNTELAEHRGLLRQIAEAQTRAQMHGQGGDVAAIKDNFAAIGTHQTDDHVETGGFAGPIGAEQADDLAGIQAEAEEIGRAPCRERGFTE